MIKVEPSTVLPFTPLEYNPYLWPPGYSDAAVFRLHQRDRDPTLDVATRPGVGLLPPGREATGESF